MNNQKCTNCKATVSLSDKFCQSCGTPVVPVVNNGKICSKCNTANQTDVAFCEKCGTSLDKSGSEPINQPGPNKIVSKGSYSGKMVKGKTSGGWKTFRNVIIVIIIIGIIALIVWIKTDPEAMAKLGNILFGFIVMLIFGLVIWRKSRKGQIKSSKERNRDDDNFDPEIDGDDSYDD